MATMNISLPDDMKVFVEAQAAERGFGTISEYVRSIIREAQEREAAGDRINALLWEAHESGPAAPMTAEDWESLRRDVRRKYAGRGAP